MSELKIIVLGPSGSGKTEIARAIQQSIINVPIYTSADLKKKINMDLFIGFSKKNELLETPISVFAHINHTCKHPKCSREVAPGKVFCMAHFLQRL